MVNKTYMTNGEETAGFMLSFKEPLIFRRLYELAYTKERFHLDEGVLRAMEEIFMERDEGDSERAKTKKSLSLDGVITADMSDTVYFDNLLGAYIDGDNLIPIRFGLKHSRTGTTTLYVIVNQNAVAKNDLNEIKKDTGHQAASPDLTESGELRRRVIYSIS